MSSHDYNLVTKNGDFPLVILFPIFWCTLYFNHLKGERNIQANLD